MSWSFLDETPDFGAIAEAQERFNSVVESTHAWPQSLDGGRLVLFTVVGRSGLWDDAKVVLQDVETRERVTVVERGTFGRYVPTGSGFL